MEKIKRKLRLFFVSYGRLTLFIIGIILLIVFVVQLLNGFSIIVNSNNTLSNIKDSNQEIIQNENEKENIQKEYIAKFIDYCNEGNIEKAYEMLSERCKADKYNTVEKFNEKYVKEVFDIFVCNYKIKKNEDIYEVKLIQDMLVTGKENSEKIEKYKFDLVLDGKIYIL